MKNKIKILLVVAMFLAITLIIYNFLKEKSHKVSYIKNNILITESYKNKQYYFEVKIGTHEINFTIDHEFKKEKKVITEIIIHKSASTTCILPIYENDETLTNYLCNTAGIIYNYKQITEKKLIEEIDNNLDKRYKNSNLLKNREIVIESTYNGYKIINKTIKDLTLFSKQEYNRELSILIEDKLVVANYNQEHRFNELIIIDIKDYTKKTIKLPKQISYDTIFQGTKNNKLYMFNLDNNQQYIVDIKTAETEIIENNIHVYKDGKLEKTALFKIKQNPEIANFEEKKEQDSTYEYIIKTENKQTSVYKIYKSNKKIIHFLTTVPDINKTIFKNNNIYYIEDNFLYKYNQTLGQTKLIENKEYIYNEHIKVFIYEEK